METPSAPISMFLILAMLVTAGCHKDPSSSQVPEVTNVRDNFHFQLTDAKNLDTSIVYYWQMEGTSANINQSSSIQGGRASVVMRDTVYLNQVYHTDLTDNGSFVTSSGAPGSWRISFTLTDFSGMIDFRAQRR